MKKVFLASLLVLTTFSLHATEKDNISMFPQAKEGYVRYAIVVPKVENPSDYKVELLIGKKILADCNQRSFFGKIKVFSLKGWGYTYLEVENIGSGATTMMACSNPPTEKFMTLQSSPESMRRYNSRLPIVIYIPKGFEVKYRIWSASKTVDSAAER